MKCPVCAATDLVMSERSGIEIDYCPQCRGVWLDRGELDKIIERSAPVVGVDRAPEHSPRYKENKYGDHGRPYHAKKSFWQELFD